MVGVAGRSKGCATCRRRKIKCDLARPACRKCSLSDRACEGYERYPVFIIKNGKGLVRRLPLAEVKPSSSGSALEKEPGLSSRASYCLSPKLTAAFPMYAVAFQRFKALFWETYSLATPSEKVWNCTSRWLYHVLEIPDPHPALREALSAISVMQCGKAKNDCVLLSHARRLYMNALRLLRTALDSAVTMQQDDILAAAGLMVLYEKRFDRTAADLEGWTSHITGLVTLLQHRGPRRHRRPSSRSALEYCRYLMMMQGLLQRRSVVLSQPDWLLVPWLNMDKSTEQKIYDYGLILAGVFERVDTAQTGVWDERQYCSIVNDCNQIQNEVEHVIEAELQPLFLNAASEHNSAILLLKILAMSITLGACTTESKARSLLRSNHDPIDEDADEEPSSTILHRTTQPIVDNKQHRLAKEIIESISIYIAGGDNEVCNAKLFFAVQQAVEQLNIDNLAYAECIEIMQRLRMDVWQFGILARI